MRSHEDRVAETKRRIAARERKERQRRNKITVLAAAAACLALIVGVQYDTSMPAERGNFFRPGGKEQGNEIDRNREKGG